MTRRNDKDGLSRRDFVKVGVTAAAVAGLPQALRANEPPQEKKDDKKDKKDKEEKGGKELIPTRELGKTGVKVSILNFGTTTKPDNRTLNAMYDAGVRYIDTAKGYAHGECEKVIAEWMKEKGNRKEIFLVTKDGPKNPDDWPKMLDERLENLKTDYVDAFFIHGVENNRLDDLKSKEWADVADKMRKSKKTKFLGFSIHAQVDVRAAALKNVAEGGWADLLMLAYDPLAVKDHDEFNKALDACAKAKVGLVAMKTMRAGLEGLPKYLPEFEKLGLTKEEAVLHAVWTDERIASICSLMPNLDQIKANTAAAKKFKPLDKGKLGAVIELYRQYAHSYCNSCDGRCRRAGGTNARLHDIVRFLAYFEMDGRRADARAAYAALTPAERDWHGADLSAASEACCNNLDFAALLQRAEAKLA